MTESVEEPRLPSPEERRRLREAAGLTYEEVATAVGVTVSTVYAWEAGRTDPRGGKRDAYVRFLTSFDPSAPAVDVEQADQADQADAVADAETATTRTGEGVGGGAALRLSEGLRGAGGQGRPLGPRNRPQVAPKRASMPPAAMPRHEAKAPIKAGTAAGPSGSGGSTPERIGQPQCGPAADTPPPPQENDRHPNEAGTAAPELTDQPVGTALDGPEPPPAPVATTTGSALSGREQIGQTLAAGEPGVPRASGQSPDEAAAGDTSQPAEPTGNHPAAEPQASRHGADDAAATSPDGPAIWPAGQSPAAERKASGQAPAAGMPAAPQASRQGPNDTTAGGTGQATGWAGHQPATEPQENSPAPAASAPDPPQDNGRGAAVVAAVTDLDGPAVGPGGGGAGDRRQVTVPAGAGPRGAFDALYQYAATALTRQAYLLTGRRGLAQEAVEQAFQKAWACWSEVATDPDPVGWVRAAAYEYALSPWHRFRRAHKHPDKAPAAPADRILMAAMLALPPVHRRTVLLYDGVGLDLPDTAAETEASTPTAGNRLLRAHAELADRIPELAAAAPEKRSALLHERLGALRPAVPLVPRPAASVRIAAEYRARRWTRAVLGLTAVIAVATGYTTVTAPRQYEPPVAPGASVSGVPPLSGPQRLTEKTKQLHDKLRADPAAGPARLAPRIE